MKYSLVGGEGVRKAQSMLNMFENIALEWKFARVTSQTITSEYIIRLLPTHSRIYMCHFFRGAAK